MTRTEKVDFIKGMLNGDKAAIEQKIQQRVATMIDEEIEARICEYKSLHKDPDVNYLFLDDHDFLRLVRIEYKYEPAFVRDLYNKLLRSDELEFITSIINRFNG
jgi:hypothetical protein